MGPAAQRRGAPQRRKCRTKREPGMAGLSGLHTSRLRTGLGRVRVQPAADEADEVGTPDPVARAVPAVPARVVLLSAELEVDMRARPAIRAAGCSPTEVGDLSDV